MLFSMPKMYFEVRKDKNGNIHVQNVVVGLGVYRGQHHVHTPKGFEKWKKIAKVRDEDLVFIDELCDCGLRPGEVKEYDGKVWFNPDFV